MLLALALVVACSDPYSETDKTPGVDTADSAAVADSASPDTGDSKAQVETGPIETGIPDSDGDGYNDDEDCVADDPSIYPGATEVWYDGIDSDCLGDSDYDQDHDGYLAAEIGGDDCDDTNSDTYPSATDAPYDGIDADCLGDDDYDRDADGDRDPSGGGEDCNDSDASVSSNAIETLDDGVDGDCNGDENGFRFSVLDTSSASGLQGPHIAMNSSYLLVTFLADSYVDDSTATTYENGGLQHYFDQSEPEAGSVGLGSWYWGSGYAMHTGFDFVADDDHEVWAYGIQDGSTRYLLVDVYDTASGIFKGTGWTYPTGKSFDDIELTTAGDGSLHVVGCDDDLGLLTWMHGDASDFFTNSSSIVGDDVSGEESDACVADVENLQALVADRSRSLLDVYRINDTSGLTSDGTQVGYTAYDLDMVKSGTHEGWFAAEGSDGVYVELDGSSTHLTSGSASDAEMEVDALGNIYAAYAHRDTGAFLGWGAVAKVMPELALDTGLPMVDSVDLAITDAGMLLVVARGGNDASWGVVAIR